MLNIFSIRAQLTMFKVKFSEKDINWTVLINHPIYLNRYEIKSIVIKKPQWLFINVANKFYFTVGNSNRFYQIENTGNK